MNVQPLVTVVITTYNHADFLPDAIASVFDQSYNNIELLIVDDGSTDNTSKLLDAYSGTKYIFQKNQGLSGARNTGIDASTGEFLLFLDADDWLYPDAVKTSIETFQKNPDAAFVFGAYEIVDKQRNIIKTVIPDISQNIYSNLLYTNIIGMHATVLYSRETFTKIRFDNSLTACEDYDIYLTIASKMKVVAHHGRVACYRMHGQNMSANYSLMLRNMQKIFDKHAESVKDPDIISRIKITKSEYAYFYLSRIIEEVSKKRKLSKEVLKLLVKYPIFVVKYFWNHAKKTFNGRKSS